jgi:hypothetical protein
MHLQSPACGALQTFSEDAGHIKQGLARLKRPIQQMGTTRFPSLSYSLAIEASSEQQKTFLLYS